LRARTRCRAGDKDIEMLTARGLGHEANGKYQQ
jgi:hypothetical protein